MPEGHPTNPVAVQHNRHVRHVHSTGQRQLIPIDTRGQLVWGGGGALGGLEVQNIGTPTAMLFRGAVQRGLSPSHLWCEPLVGRSCVKSLTMEIGVKNGEKTVWEHI